MLIYMYTLILPLVLLNCYSFIQGDIGQKGDAGSTGLKGEKGETGMKGSQGPVGPPGPPAVIDVHTICSSNI